MLSVLILLNQPTFCSQLRNTYIFNLLGTIPDSALVLIVGLPVFIYLIILIYEQRKYDQHGRLSLAFIGTIFFGLSMGLFLPEDLIPELWLILAMGLDLILLGIGIAIHDAFQEGHTLRVSMWYSLQNAFFVVLLIGGQVVLAIMGLGISKVLLTLMMGLLATGIAIVVIVPRMHLAKTAEIIETSALNLNPNMDFSALSDKDFIRYTRRALSYLDDLPRLASSPLIQLLLIETRLTDRNVHMDTLARTNELKNLLIDEIDRLKPETTSNFETTDDWRYYNAVYFPYVAGLKPSRR